MKASVSVIANTHKQTGYGLVDRIISGIIWKQLNFAL